VIQDGVERIRKEDEHNVPRFLNRILALEVDPQNALFHYFAELFDQTVRYAKASGTFDEGVTDIKALAIRVAKPPSVVHRDHVTGAETVLYTLEVDRPNDKVSFERADRLRESNHGAFFRHQTKGDFILALQSGRHTDPADGKTFLTYSVWKPGGSRTSYIREQELNSRYRVVRPDEPRSWWTRQHGLVPEIETREARIVGGAVIPLWQKLKTKDEARLRVARVSTEDGQRIVGVEIPHSQVGQVLPSLGLKGPAADPGQVFRELLAGSAPLDLTSGLTLKRSTLERESAIELVCADPDRFHELRGLGLINEQIRYRQRFFVPSDEGKGSAILTDLLTRYPIMSRESEEPEDSPQESLSVEIPATEITVVDLEHWVLAPEEKEASPANDVAQPPALPAPCEAQLPERQGVSLAALLEQRAMVPIHSRRKSLPVIEEQGVLFSLDPRSIDVQ